MNDQDGTPTSLGYVLRSVKEQTAEEHNTDVLSSKTIVSSQRGTTDLLLVDLHAWLDNALEDYCQTKNVDRLVATKTALRYMQSKMLWLTATIPQERLSTSQANNATCVENSQWQQESCESSGQTEKSGSISLSQFKNQLWNSSVSAFRKRTIERKNRESK